MKPNWPSALVNQGCIAINIDLLETMGGKGAKALAAWECVRQLVFAAPIA